MKIIPTPQYSEYELCFGKPLAENTSKVYIEPDLKQKCKPALAFLKDFTECDEDSATLIITDKENTASRFVNIDNDWFLNKNACEQGYIINGTEDGKTVIYAPSFMGIMYGICTFVQIPAVKNGFVIKDYPDFRFRANKWILWAETAIFSYDFGDGLENLLLRVKRKLDNCLKFKINMLFFDACGADTERTPEYKTFMKSCNAMAKKRGIRLIVCSYSMGYGLSGHPFAKYFGKVHKNLKNGETYECMGTFIHDKRNGGKPYVLAREYGTCISNDALTDEKVRELCEFIREVRPGALYLHNMDSCYVDKALWQARCDDCRKRWPSDDLFAKDGMAGAFAYFFDRLNGALQSVKTEDYDSENDLVIFNVAPGYLEPKVEDCRVEDATRFWAAVQSYQTVTKNVMPLFREMFYNKQDNQKRIPDLVAKHIKDFGVVVFAGSDGFYSDKLFSLSACLSYMYKGASTVITCSGTAFCEPLSVFNSEYMWNCENSAFYNAKAPDNFDGFMEYFDTLRKSNIYPDQVYKKGGMLDIICQKLYGKNSDKMYEFFSLHGKDCECPAPFACNKETGTSGNNVLLDFRWDNPISKAELDSYITKFGRIRNLNEQGLLLLSGCDDADIKEYHRLLLLNTSLISFICKYLELYKEIETGKADKETLLKTANELIKTAKENADLSFKTVDALGGALSRRQEIFETLKYNLELMCDSIKTDKRIPDSAKKLQDENWW